MPETTHQQRLIARRAIGDELRAAAGDILHRMERAPARSGHPIALHEANGRNDIGLRWWHPLVAPIAESLVALEQLDYDSPRQVGSNVRGIAAGLVEAAEPTERFLAFLDEFEDGSIPYQLATLIRGELAYATHLILEVADDRADDSHERDAFLAAGENWAETMLTAHEIIEEIANSEHQASREDIIESVFGRRPSGRVGHYATIPDSLGVTSARDRLRLAARQLRLVADETAIPEHSADTWLGEAVRAALQPFPLLTHRTAVLMDDLIGRAIAADADAVVALFVAFSRAQVARVISNASESQRLFLGRAPTDAAALIASYKKLAEGVLRPFGALVAHLEAVANQSATPRLSARPLLGDLESALQRTRSELGRLLLRGLARPIRNAAAHEDVVLDAAGRHSILESDGTVTPIDLDALAYDRGVLEAALTGVDVANNAAVWKHLANYLDYAIALDGVVATAEALEQMANVAARATGVGHVTDLEANEGEVSLVLHGEPKELQLLSFLVALSAHIDPGISRIAILDEARGMVVEFVRTDEDDETRFPD